MMTTLFGKTVSWWRALVSSDVVRFAGFFAIAVVMTYLVFLVTPAISAIAHWIVEAMFEGRLA